MTTFDEIEWAYQNDELQVGWHDDRPDMNEIVGWDAVKTCWHINAWPSSILWSKREPVYAGVGVEHATWFMTKEKADAFISDLYDMGWHYEVLHAPTDTNHTTHASHIREGYMVNA